MNKKLYTPFKSILKTKKYSVYVKNEEGKPKLIHFGHRASQHYKDKIGVYKSKNHMDAKRRKSYLARAKGIKNKKGELTWKDKNTVNYWLVHYLW